MTRRALEKRGIPGRPLRFALAPVLLAVLGATFAPAQVMTDAALDREFEFASGLVDLGFPDFADKVVEQVLKRMPDQKERAQLIRAQIALSNGQFDQAQAIIDGMPPDSPKAQAITLALAGAYYRMSDMDKARQVYDAFFKQYKGRVPTDPDLVRFYQEAAYQFGQMLEKTGDISGAVQAYARVLATKPDKSVARKLMADQAALYVRLAETDNDARWLDEARKLCNEIQWGGLDVHFGNSIITMARIELARDDKTAAQKVLKDNLDILKEIDAVLKDQPEMARENPMAGARFMLGQLHQEKGDQLAVKGQKDEAVEHLGKALIEYYNVFAKYGASDWGPESGVRAAQLKERLEKEFGKQIKIDLTGHEEQAASTQFRLADTLFTDKNYQKAADEYVKVLNQFPDSATVPAALYNLAQCYANLKDEIYVKMLAHYLGERFYSSDKAALALLGLGKFYFDLEDKPMYGYLYGAYLDYFPKHERAAGILYTLAGLAKQEGDGATADRYYRRIIAGYSNDLYYVKALSRIAWDSYQATNYAKAVTDFQAFAQAAQPGYDKAQAQFYLADAHRLIEKYEEAIQEYGQLLKWLEPADSPFNGLSQDAEKNKDLAQRALFFIGYCYARIPEPAESVPEFRRKGIAFAQLFLQRHPDSEFAPRAMNSIGTMQLELGLYDEAVGTFDQLAAKYPNSDEGRNAIYSLIRSAMEVKKFDVARAALNKMVARAGSYSPDEFGRIGQLMLDAELWPEAITAFSQVVQRSDERTHLERALYGLGSAHYALKKYPEATKSLEELMERYPKSGLFYEAKFILGSAYRETGRLDEAVLAISDVSRFADDVVTINRASYVLGQIQNDKGEKEAAMASFQRVALLADPANPALRALVEDCIVRSIALAMELGRYLDAGESCDQYLQVFPDSEKIPEIRRIKAEAKLKLAEAAAQQPVPGAASAE